jgi:hypothetical protein
MNDVPMVCRGLGHCPTEMEMNKILESLGYPEEK